MRQLSRSPEEGTKGDKGDRLLFNLGLPIGLIAGSNPNVLTNRFYHFESPVLKKQPAPFPPRTT